MANPEHLEILKQGVVVWNKWRELSPEINPDLSEAELPGFDLHNINLDETDLNHAILTSADMSGAMLYATNLTFADLDGAILKDAIIIGIDLRYTSLIGTDFTRAVIKALSFGNQDLRKLKGIETIYHESSSTIGIDTLYRSHGEIPEVFLRGCGVPEPFIVQIPALIASLEPIQFYSCFISYSSKDHSFAERLHADLQSRGVRCWFAPEDLKIGAEIRTGIDESIRVHDKLLLVMSETSVKSQWVQQEVETALAQEREQGRTVLFPIRLDDAMMEVNAGWPSYLRNTRNIGDFRTWKDHDSYTKAFDRLLRDLKADDSQAAEG